MNNVLNAVSRVHELRNTFDQTFTKLPHEQNELWEDLLAIRVAKRSYAISVLELSGIVACKKIVPIPSPLPQLLGIAGVRGRLIPIFALSYFLDHSLSEQTRWLVLSASNQIGFVFDEWEGYLRVLQSHIHSSNEGKGNEYIQRFAHVDNIVRPILHIPSILKTIQEQGSLSGSTK